MVCHSRMVYSRRMKKTVCLTLLFLLKFCLSFANTPVELPSFDSDALIVVHPGFTLRFNVQHSLSDWVAYELTAEEALSQTATRTDSFKPDPYLPGLTATDSAYRGSGYDRGHLAPAADMKFSKEAMAASFYFSNIAPQKPLLNRRIWAALEALVRSWAIDYGSVYIATGPLLNTETLPRLSGTNVSIPTHFYKCILVRSESSVQAIAFIIPNEQAVLELSAYAISIDAAEEITGLDFYASLPDEIELLVEESFQLDKWINLE